MSADAAKIAFCGDQRQYGAGDEEMEEAQDKVILGDRQR